MRAWIGLAGLLLIASGGVAGAGEAGAGKAAAVRTTVKELRQHQGAMVVLLQTDGGKQLLPIWIGVAEAQAIQLRLASQAPVRPLTLDLLQTMLSVLGARVERVEVDDLREGVFTGKVSLRDARGRAYRVDGRPSDLIGLALGAKLPVHVAPHVLRKAAVDGTAPSVWTSPPTP